MDGPQQSHDDRSDQRTSARQGADLFGQTAAEPPASAPSRQSEYVVVARRYRPQSFGELVGQDAIGRALSNAIVSQRVGHAYLFTGARGVGKTSSARILAKALNCVRGPTPTPCNQCDICRSISTGEDVDVLEIDGASNRGIDEIRELRQNVNVRPSRSRFKIYIIDEVHMLTTPAFNALLKTLEEPPEHVKFIFCTTEAEKIPITILSRCQRFDFAGISVSAIAERLRTIAENEGVSAEPEALELLARRAAGSMRDSQSLLEQLLAFGGDRITAADVHAMLGTAADKRLGQILELLVKRQPGEALKELDEALAEGVDVGQVIGQLLGVFRDALVAAVGAGTESFLHVGPSCQQVVKDAAGRLGVNTLLAAMQILDHTLGRMRYSTHGRTLAELALVRIAGLEDLEAIATLVGELERRSSPRGDVAIGKQSTGADRTTSKKKPDAPPLARDPPAATPASPRRQAQSTSPGGSAIEAVELRREEEVATRHFNPADQAPGPRQDAPVAENQAVLDTWELWQQALDRVEDTTRDHARRVHTTRLATPLAISGPKQLVASFPAKYTSSKSLCEKPDRIEKLAQALSEVAGENWTVRFEISSAAGETAAGEANSAVPRRDLVAEMSRHPLVKKAVDLFGSRVVRVEEGNRKPTENGGV